MDILREALEIARKRQSNAINRGVIKTLEYGISDHADGDCAAAEKGRQCQIEKMARDIVAGRELGWPR
jgi:hypothetical protein